MPVLHIAETDSQTAALPGALNSTSGPVVVMVHGFKYRPHHPVRCPFGSILSRTPHPGAKRSISWPRHLGLRGQRSEPLAIGFGWDAGGTIWKAYRRAGQAGAALGALLARIQQLSPGRPVHIVAHSLGARVALCALGAARPGAVSRAVLLAGAEYGSLARKAAQSPAGRAARVLNVTSRENDLFDFLMERAIAPPCPGDRMLGHGGGQLANMAVLQLDDPGSLQALRRAGFPIAPPKRRICHWSPYLRPGVFPLYRAFLDGRLELDQLKTLLPERLDARWSRLVPMLANSVARDIPARRSA